MKTERENTLREDILLANLQKNYLLLFYTHFSKKLKSRSFFILEKEKYKFSEKDLEVLNKFLYEKYQMRIEEYVLNSSKYACMCA